MTRIAVVGLGAMGSRMARRLLDAGHELHVWNRDAAKAAVLAQQGATPASSPAAAARATEVVITMVTDAHALRDVTEGEDGLLAGVSSATTIVQTSTVGPVAIERLAAALPPGVGLIDAPVLGSIGEAESGTLRIFVSGEPALVERWTPLLSTLGAIMNVGPLGAGTAAKLTANAALVGVLSVLGESLALARALGLQDDVAFQVLGVTPIAAQAERRRPAIASSRYPPRFALALALKDANLILDAAEARRLTLRAITAARDWLSEAKSAGLGDQDYSAALERMLRPPSPT